LERHEADAGTSAVRRNVGSRELRVFKLDSTDH